MIDKYLSYLRHERNYSKHTEISYYTDLKQFESFLQNDCENIPITDADGDIIRMWIIKSIDKGLTPRSANRKLSTLKSFYHFLLKTNKIEFNPAKKITGPKASKPIPSFINHPDMEISLELDDNNDEFINHRNKMILEIFYISGIRRAELINLKNTDIDLSLNTIRVTGKRNKQRIIPFSENAKKLIERYIHSRNSTIEKHSEHFFVKKDGNPIYPMLVHRIVHEKLEWIPTLAKASPHALRHSFATSMLNNGAEINAVKELLGHSSLASTEIYTHTSFEELKKNYKKAHPRA